MAKRKKYNGIYSVKGINGISYGIDYVHPQTGKRIRKILKGCASESDAFQKRSIELADAARGAINKAYGIQGRGRPVVFNDMVDLYLTDWSALNKAVATDRARSVRLKEFFDRRLMSDITPFLVEKFKRQMVKDYSKRTVDKWLSLGSQVFEKALLWGKYNGENPFLKIKRFNVGKGQKPGSLTPEQVAAIIDEIKHPTIKAMVEFGYNTGWRVGEIVALQWSHVDLDRGVAWIADPKNKKPVEIVLSLRALKIIDAQPRISDAVFSKSNGEPFKKRLQKGFKAAADRAGVHLPSRKVWHILRRTWASMFLQSGGDVETLRVLGNWRDFSMPMWYADASSADRQREILNRMPDINDRNKPEIANVVSLTG